MSLILALDFGGTKLAAAVTQLGDSEWLRYERQLSPADSNATTDLEIMRSLIHTLLQGETPSAIGVSFGGPVDFTTGTVRLSHHVPGWENIPLKNLLEEEFGVAASVDNDANVAALGEHRFGAGQGYDNLFYITISTGVGGGWILSGQPWRGAAGMAGEIGHTVVNPAGPICLCGKRGCVERLASGPYMAQDAKESLLTEPHKFSSKILQSLVNNNLDLITGKTISDAAAQGDELAIDILQNASWALGTGIGNVANLMNPQLFILGGSVTKAGENWWQTVQKTARKTALSEIEFEIVPAALGDDAPLWGAVALAESSFNV
ncbi:ROK family protein [Nostoc sp. FACHB-110]|uniref:ROK family protein n=1 Tax=Nostoc sp. FACHB-110 TaxID=2692834 RepID=UPI0016858CEA|nr:ROK family protein [Nostoc sp. FACHB-110]MBD2439627.1 ROK family protein [Nostoc sp. FACHB-110]